jgi:actin-related protein 3
VLSGGSTLFKGFDTRLEKNLQKRVNTRLELFNKGLNQGEKAEIKCTVSQNIVQRYAVWFGGSVLGSQEHFHTICKSREDYAEHGPSICRHNAIFQN